jgi:hypothetical protein
MLCFLLLTFNFYLFGFLQMLTRRTLPLALSVLPLSWPRLNDFVFAPVGPSFSRVEQRD